jgi:hypothetical protein
MAKRKMKVMKDKGHLTAAGRRSLPSSDFALPGKGSGPEGKGSGSYPIPDEGHARAAAIKRKVKAKFPGMALHDHPRSKAM